MGCRPAVSHGSVDGRMEPYAVAHGDAVLGFTVISLDPRTVDRPFGRGGEAERQKQQEEKRLFHGRVAVTLQR